MSITLPTNIPSGERRTAAVSLRKQAVVRDPLSDYTRSACSSAAPLSIALKQARKALAAHEGRSIHDHMDAISAAVGLGYALRQVLEALEAQGGAA